ncbi:MAG TPA: hypothetical protein VFW05_09800 [Verrucomicrobiae bacterium]|jgi:hypothetical protein|nr:hypothetical protein [Verrucomicrobiae bacterium]
MNADQNTIEPKKRRWKRAGFISACAVVAVAGALIALCYGTPLSYIYCLAREKSWLAAKTEAELDGRMWAFYTKRSIAPSNSMWGHDYALKPDERMVQYLVFAKEPLDVVFDRDSRVVAAFTSYE